MYLKFIKWKIIGVIPLYKIICMLKICNIFDRSNHQKRSMKILWLIIIEINRPEETEIKNKSTKSEVAVRSSFID